MSQPAQQDRSRPDALRASDADRERTAQALRHHAGVGRLEVAELEERLGAAYAATTFGDLRALTRDLPGTADPARAERPAPSPPRRRVLEPHVAVWLACSVLFVVIWAATGTGYFWPVWPILGWGLGVLGPAHRGSCGARRRTAHPR